ncbi:MAG: hypothetical protein LBD17_04435 [Endomicrobium sp.]|jgi:hypothetical protein|nr:hypothetical protein [Endomicrobium sp.]
MKRIKIFFYTLFSLDVLASFIIAIIANVMVGVVTAIVLLFLNITVYAIILKAYKAGKNGTK